jgi:hypothetical protein
MLPSSSKLSVRRGLPIFLVEDRRNVNHCEPIAEILTGKVVSKGYQIYGGIWHLRRDLALAAWPSAAGATPSRRGEDERLRDQPRRAAEGTEAITNRRFIARAAGLS